jgi:hypothetical protein
LVDGFVSIKMSTSVTQFENKTEKFDLERTTAALCYGNTDTADVA